MRRTILTLALLSLSFSLLLITGCGGKAPVDGGMEIDVPEWFSSLPNDPNYLYAVATDKQRDMQLSIDSAKQAASNDITRQIEVKVNALFKRFREQVGMGEDAELLSQTTDVSKSVSAKVLSGLQSKEQKVLKEGVSYRAYSLFHSHFY